MAAPSTASVYPNFSNGDVDLALSTARRLRLHSDVLRGASDRFKELLCNENAAILSAKARKKGDATRFRIELVNVGELHEIGDLVAQKLDANGRIIYEDGPRVSMILDRFGADPDNHVLEDWESVIGALYGRPVKIGGSHHFCEVLTRTMNLVMIAEYLQLENTHIFTAIELALVETQQALWRSIQAGPMRWVELALRIKSVAVFKEAATHLIGTWHTITPQEKNSLEPEVHELFSREAAKFVERKKAVQKQILQYKPNALQYVKNVDRVKGKREHDPHIFVWIGFSGFQMWLAQYLAEGNGVDGPDGGWGFFKLLHNGGEEYYTREAQADYAGCSGPGRAIVSNSVQEIKEAMKELVKDVMVKNLRLDVHQSPVEYFACFDIERKHCPWTDEALTPEPADEPSLGDSENDDSDLEVLVAEDDDEEDSTDMAQMDGTKEAPYKRTHEEFVEDDDDSLFVQ
ncbi:uncharacterized protein J3D65DRAFT_603117 [Phyllosticta citribraziliensis]|uniref:BTB domain-containing protein n=1 Tax=Phyllosticta citribraziliensis TaxID=989973 RepID=A0ABR1LPK4_9PEZI